MKAAQDKFGGDSGTSMNPSTRKFIARAYNAPASERSFTIILLSLASRCSVNLGFTLPQNESSTSVSEPNPLTSPDVIATIRVDHCVFELTGVLSDPRMDFTRLSLVLLGWLTNEVTQIDTFSTTYAFLFRGAMGMNVKTISQQPGQPRINTVLKAVHL